MTYFLIPLEVVVVVGVLEALLDWKTFVGIRTYHFVVDLETQNLEDHYVQVEDHWMAAFHHRVACLVVMLVVSSYSNLTFHNHPSGVAEQ